MPVSVASRNELYLLSLSSPQATTNHSNNNALPKPATSHLPSIKSQKFTHQTSNIRTTTSPGPSGYGSGREERFTSLQRSAAPAQEQSTADANVCLAARNCAMLASSSLSFLSAITGQSRDAFPFLSCAETSSRISATLKPAFWAARTTCNRLNASRG